MRDEQHLLTTFLCGGTPNGITQKTSRGWMSSLLCAKAGEEFLLLGESPTLEMATTVLCRVARVAAELH